MQDLWLIEQIARRLGLPWSYRHDDDGDGRVAAEAPVARVYEEMRVGMAPLAGVPWRRLVRDGAVVTPAAREDDPGEAVVFTTTSRPPTAAPPWCDCIPARALKPATPTTRWCSPPAVCSSTGTPAR